MVNHEILLFLIYSIAHLTEFDAILKQHSYEPSSRRCLSFKRYPCKSSTNIFISLSECKQKCQINSSTTHTDDLLNDKHSSSGIKYFLSPFTLTCKIFDYKHCKNNVNLFNTPTDCDKYCKSNSPGTKICNLPKEVGPCKALIPRWYYSSIHKKCEEFDYGGCQGNENNFVSIEHCQRTCIKY